MSLVAETSGIRITLKRARPNPLFQEWLEDLHDQAKTKNSKLEPMLRQALVSLSKYPLPLESGADCAILKGFNRKLCLFIDRQLENYSKELQSHNPSPGGHSSNDSNTETGIASLSQMSSDQEIIKQSSEKLESIQSNNNNVDEHKAAAESRNTNKAKSKSRTYKPAFRSGSYAILVALLEHSKENPNKPNLNKSELIERAQIHSDESFVRPKPDTFYTAWSNMSRLITKGLVCKVRSKNVCYSLSEEGVSLAAQLLQESKDKPTTNDIIFNGSIPSTRLKTATISEESSGVSPSVESSQNSLSTSQELECIELPAGSFDVILLIDKNETSGVSKKNDPTVAQFNKYPDLQHEYRSLKVGDFTWVARHKVNRQELVLPYVVERKRMDDLGASVKDGRFHEQKFRLRKCGLKNVIYLVEKYGSDKHVGLPKQSLEQALANTRVQDGFKVHRTESLSHSVRFLAMMTKRLTIEYSSKNLKGFNRESSEEALMSFVYFNKYSSKSKALTVTETFIKLLLQLKGVSIEKALAITKTYSTPSSLMKVYQHCTTREGETLLARLKYDDLNSRNIGPAVSKSIYQLFSNKELI